MGGERRGTEEFSHVQAREPVQSSLEHESCLFALLFSSFKKMKKCGGGGEVSGEGPPAGPL